MNSIILCEGTTDAILLSYYLIKINGWSHAKKGPKEYANIKIDNNQELNWYKKSEHFLAIWGVGGKDRFQDVIDNYLLQMIMNYPESIRFKKIAIITDKDDNDIERLEKLQASWFGNNITEIKNNSWVRNTWKNEFGNNIETDILSIIIPTDKQGALETVLLDSISEDKYDEYIVKECGQFVKEIRPKASNYISSNRLELKAHLATTFSVISPERVFTTLNELINKTEWEKSDTLKECFSPLNDI